MTGMQLWALTVIGGAVVVLVVWLLLALIVGSARRIKTVVDEIWIVGPGIANNTAHVGQLRSINRVAGEILAGAGKVAAHSGRIHEHANGCPGCPHCVTGWGAPGSGPGA